MLVIVLLLALGGGGQAMTAYDCGHREATRVALDTTSPPECADDSSDFLPVQEVNAQLLRVNGAKTVTAAHCYVTYSTRVYGCHGLSHYTSASSYTSFKVVTDLVPQVCWAAAKQQMFSFDRLEVNPVHTPRGVWRHSKGFTRGKYRASGYCDELETFVSGGEIHEDSMEETFGDVHLKFVTGIYDATTKEITFSNGLKAPASDRRSFDVYSGVLEWEWSDEDESDACERLNEIQRGPFRVYAKANATLLEQAVVVSSEKQADPTKRLGAQLGSRVRTCERTCYAVTSLPDYRFCLFDEDSEPLFPQAQYDEEQVLAEWGQYQLEHSMIRADHQYLVTSLRGKNELRHLRARMCEAERRTLWNKLQAISGSRNLHALRDIYGPGYQLTPAGPSVAYLTKCVPMEVTLAPYPNCTAEVPVLPMGNLRNGTVLFMDSITHTLKAYPEIIHCSELMPPMFKFNGQWMVANPEAVPATVEPKALPASLLTSNHLVDDFSHDVRAGGLLGEQQVLDVRARLAEVDARDAVLTRATSVATQDVLGPGGNRPLGSLLSAEDYHQLQRWGSIPWLFEKVGSYFYFLFTITAGLSLVLSFVKGILTLYQDFTLYGWDGGKTLLRALPHLLGVVTLPISMVRAVVAAHGETAGRFPGRQLLRLGRAGQDPDKRDVEGGEEPSAPEANPPPYVRLAKAMEQFSP